MESLSQEKRKTKRRGLPGHRAIYQVDTKGTCLLCLRERHQFSSKKQNDTISPKFCKVLLRYLKIDFHQNIVKPSNFKWKASRVKKVGIELCQDCSLLAASFCDMYSQFELIQMRINACVKTISDIMRIAGRIPSRVKAYQERMGMVQTNLAKGVNSHPARPKAVLLVKNLRKELIQKSLDKNKWICPQVKLTRCTNDLSAHHSQQLLARSTSSTAKTKKNANAISILTTPLSPIQLQFKNFLLAYVLSFATVWLLGILGGEKSVPGLTRVPLNVANTRAIEDSPIESSGDSTQAIDNTCPAASCSNANKASTDPDGASNSKGTEVRRNSINNMHQRN